jgi:hypothetical protein
MNPPLGLGIPVVESVSVYNRTLHDYIELSYFYTKVFLTKISNASEY